VPILYEALSFSPNEKADSEKTLTIELIGGLTCPVCGEEGFPDQAALEEHMKTAHWFHWHFWYAPHGKPLLALTAGGTILATAFAFAPKEPRIIVVGGK